MTAFPPKITILLLVITLVLFAARVTAAISPDGNITTIPPTTLTQLSDPDLFGPVTLTLIFPRHAIPITTFSPDLTPPTTKPTDAFWVDTTLSWEYPSLPPNTKLDIQIWSFYELSAQPEIQYSPTPVLLATLETSTSPIVGSKVSIYDRIPPHAHSAVVFRLVYTNIDPLLPEPLQLQVIQSQYFTILPLCYIVDNTAPDSVLGTTGAFLNTCETTPKPFCSLLGTCQVTDDAYVTTQASDTRKAKCRKCSSTGTSSCDSIGTCICKAGYSGLNCFQHIDCAPTRDLLCSEPRYGYVARFSNGSCATTCSCFSGAFGERCTCPLSCPDGTRTSDDCSTCQCPMERTGNTCNCWGVTAELTIPFSNDVIATSKGLFPSPARSVELQSKPLVFDGTVVSPAFYLPTAMEYNQLDFLLLGQDYWLYLASPAAAPFTGAEVTLTIAPSTIYLDSDPNQIAPIDSTTFTIGLSLECGISGSFTFESFVTNFLPHFPTQPTNIPYFPSIVDPNSIQWRLYPSTPSAPLPLPVLQPGQVNLGAFTMTTMLGKYQLDLFSTNLETLTDGDVSPDYTTDGSQILHSSIPQLGSRAVSADAAVTWQFSPSALNGDNGGPQLVSFSIEVWSYPLLDQTAVPSESIFSPTPVHLSTIKPLNDVTTTRSQLVSLLPPGFDRAYSYAVIRLSYTYEIIPAPGTESNPTTQIKLISQSIPFSIQSKCFQPNLVPTQYGSHPFSSTCLQDGHICTITGECRPSNELQPPNTSQTPPQLPQPTPLKCSKCHPTKTTTCTELDSGLCQCAPEWTGPTCHQPTQCLTQSEEHCVDPIVGFVDFVEARCQAECTCSGHFSGYKCHICTLQCLNGGQPFNDCNRCGCVEGYSGDRCQCQHATGTIQLTATNDIISSTNGKFTSSSIPLRVNSTTTTWGNYSPVGVTELDYNLYQIIDALYNEFELSLHTPPTFTITPTNTTTTTFSFDITFGCPGYSPDTPSLEAMNAIGTSSDQSSISLIP